MTSSLVLKLLCGVAAVSFAFPVLAQDPPADPVVDEVAEEAPEPGITFLKPPERPLLGTISPVETTATTTTTTPAVTRPTTKLPSIDTLTDEVLASFNDPALTAFLRAVNFSTTKVGFTPQYQFYVDGANANLPSNVQSSMKLNPIVFGVIDKLDLLATITLERDFSIEEVQNDSIIYNQIDIENFAVDWGGIAFSGNGVFDVDGGGLLSGTLQLTVTSWNNSVDLSDFIDGQQASQIEVLLSVLTLGDELTLPVTLESGKATIGQLVIGTVPSIYK